MFNVIRLCCTKQAKLTKISFIDLIMLTEKCNIYNSSESFVFMRITLLKFYTQTVLLPDIWVFHDHILVFFSNCRLMFDALSRCLYFLQSVSSTFLVTIKCYNSNLTPHKESKHKGTACKMLKRFIQKQYILLIHLFLWV